MSSSLEVPISTCRFIRRKSWNVRRVRSAWWQRCVNPTEFSLPRRTTTAVCLAEAGARVAVQPGLVKTALDYVEDLRDEPAPYFDGRPVGCILTGSGAQGAVTALTSLRAVIHALRGWPTPLGVCINTSSPVFDETGVCLVDSVQPQLVTVGRQVVRCAAAAKASTDLSRPA